MKRVIVYLKRETVLCIAVFLAVISMFFVRPDRAYAEYIDTRVLALLFCLMTIMEGFKKTEYTAEKGTHFPAVDAGSGGTLFFLLYVDYQ